MKIYPSLISAPHLLNLEQTITELDPLSHGYHIDVMDDHFVPNLTWGPAFVNAIIAATKRPVNVHLMVSQPERWIDRLSLRSEDLFIFHYEACSSINQMQEILSALKKKSIRSGIALKPETPVTVVEPLLASVDSVLLMSVQPGFSGQPFMHEIVQKIPQLVSLQQLKKSSCTIGIDGGVVAENIPMLRDLGVDYAAVATAIFGTSDSVRALHELVKLAA